MLAASAEKMAGQLLLRLAPGLIGVVGLIGAAYLWRKGPTRLRHIDELRPVLPLSLLMLDTSAMALLMPQSPWFWILCALGGTLMVLCATCLWWGKPRIIIPPVLRPSR